MVRATIIGGAVFSVAGLMITGAKVGSLVVDAQQAAKDHDLKERETQLMATAREALDKREADLKRREMALAASVEAQEATLTTARAELAKLRESQRASEEAAVRAERRRVASEAATPAPQPVQAQPTSAQPTVQQQVFYRVTNAGTNYTLWSSTLSCTGGRRLVTVTRATTNTSETLCWTFVTATGEIDITPPYMPNYSREHFVVWQSDRAGVAALL